MGLKFKAVDPVVFVAGVAVTIVLWKSYIEGKKVVIAVKEVVTEDLNPVSDKNFVNKSFNATTAALTGSEYHGFSFGAWLAGKLNPVEKYEQQALNRMDKN